MSETYQVGFDRQVITPDEPIPLGGYSNEPQRYMKAITEDICVTCTAITDSSDTSIMLVGLDFLRVNDHIGEPGREIISRLTGIPEHQIFFCATHTHSGPGLDKEDWPEVQRYRQKVFEKMELAAKNAWEDRKPSRLYAGSVETENLNFVRHYIGISKTTGEYGYLGDGFGNPKDKDIISHATPVDPTLHVLQFKRDGGKEVVLANFRAHAHFTGGSYKYDLSSDFPWAFRKALEAMRDCHAFYLQGACGNVNEKSRIGLEQKFMTCRSHGMALAAYAENCLSLRMQPVEAGKIKVLQKVFYGEINHSMDHLADKAWEIRDYWNRTFDKATAMEMARPLGIRSVYHANAIKQNSMHRKKDGKMILNAVQLSDELAFVTFPGELFDVLGQQVEDRSPYQKTLLLGYSHHHVGYLPSMVAYKYSSYETDTTRFAPGTGETVVDQWVAMLRELKADNGK